MLQLRQSREASVNGKTEGHGGLVLAAGIQINTWQSSGIFRLY